MVRITLMGINEHFKEKVKHIRGERTNCAARNSSNGKARIVGSKRRDEENSFGSYLIVMLNQFKEPEQNKR